MGMLGTSLCLSGAGFTELHAGREGCGHTAAWAGYWLDYH